MVQQISVRHGDDSRLDSRKNIPDNSVDKYSLRKRQHRASLSHEIHVPLSQHQQTTFVEKVTHGSTTMRSHRAKVVSQTVPKIKMKAAPLSKYRRKTANARERSRMREINLAFESLRQCVPPTIAEDDVSSTNEKLTKITTLRLAMKYIRKLSKALTEPNFNIDFFYRSSSPVQNRQLSLCDINSQSTKSTPHSMYSNEENLLRGKKKRCIEQEPQNMLTSIDSAGDSANLPKACVPGSAEKWNQYDLFKTSMDLIHGKLYLDGRKNCCIGKHIPTNSSDKRICLVEQSIANEDYFLNQQSTPCSSPFIGMDALSPFTDLFHHELVDYSSLDSFLV